ncbi:MAG: GDSL-type esterase/lipase family protein [Planctomycetaceae bacterium]|jgi:beta-glucosidase|nr:GDSL-type esterase/lipase family protein [Planctomycetaceae bacterium]
MKKNKYIILSAVILLSGFVAGVLGHFYKTKPNVSASVPAAINETQWQERHRIKIQEMEQGTNEMLLIGDSIMYGWETHKDICEKYFGTWTPLNLGFYGDQTQNVLWRLNNMPLHKVKPKYAVVLIGTNNVGWTNSMSPENTAEGIRAIVKILHDACPQMRIIVLKIFPRSRHFGFLQKRIDRLNKILPSVLHGMENVTVTDINSGFLNTDGSLKKEFFADPIHLNSAGYDYWGRAMQRELRQHEDAK